VEREKRRQKAITNFLEQIHQAVRNNIDNLLLDPLSKALKVKALMTIADGWNSRLSKALKNWALAAQEAKFRQQLREALERAGLA
jgi:uncharacterized protein YnzC (UPF0291/DUF896 family)